jgi:hypothetical protein
MRISRVGLSFIAASIGLVTNTVAADTLEGSFKEGKVRGVIKSMYRDVSVDSVHCKH